MYAFRRGEGEGGVPCPSCGGLGGRGSDGNPVLTRGRRGRGRVPQTRAGVSLLPLPPSEQTELEILPSHHTSYVGSKNKIASNESWTYNTDHHWFRNLMPCWLCQVNIWLSIWIFNTFIKSCSIDSRNDPKSEIVHEINLSWRSPK